MAESNLDLLQDVSTNQVDNPIPSSTKENDNSMFIGEALDDDEKLNLLMTDSKPYITILIGFEGYGKTSFVATSYHLLLDKGSIGDYKFVDSDTLVGLERRLFLRRLSEDLYEIKADTKRTIRGEAHLLSFHLVKDDEEKIFIFSDHSGEDYKEFADKKGLVDKDILLSNADLLLFFIDVSKLLGTEILTMRQYYIRLLENMKKAKVFKQNTKIILLFNKVDIVNDDKECIYLNKRNEFISLFKRVSGVENIDSKDIVSNNIQNTHSLNDLLLDIVNSTSNRISIGSRANRLDWVKQFIKEH